MDKELLELEAELRCLRPRAGSPQLLATIERELATAAPSPARHDRSATSWTSWKWANWAAAAILAAVVMLASHFWPHGVAPVPRGVAASVQPPTAEFTGYKPVAAERTLYGADDEGLVTLADGRIGRRLRSQYIDTITWRNPATNASLRWSVPREEVRIVPVNAY